MNSETSLILPLRRPLKMAFPCSREMKGALPRDGVSDDARSWRQLRLCGKCFRDY